MSIASGHQDHGEENGSLTPGSKGAQDLKWIKELGFPSSCDVDDVSDLRSGQVLMDVVAVALQGVPPEALTLTPSHVGPPVARLREVVRSMSIFVRGMGAGSDSMTEEQTAQASERLAAMLQEGYPRLTDTDLLWLLALLRRVSGHGGRLPQTSAPGGRSQTVSQPANEPGPTSGETNSDQQSYVRQRPSNLRSPLAEESVTRSTTTSLHWGDQSHPPPRRGAAAACHPQPILHVFDSSYPLSRARQASTSPPRLVRGPRSRHFSHSPSHRDSEGPASPGSARHTSPVAARRDRELVMSNFPSRSGRCSPSQMLGRASPSSPRRRPPSVSSFAPSVAPSCATVTSSRAWDLCRSCPDLLQLLPLQRTPEHHSAR